MFLQKPNIFEAFEGIIKEALCGKMIPNAYFKSIIFLLVLYGFYVTKKRSCKGNSSFRNVKIWFSVKSAN